MYDRKFIISQAVVSIMVLGLFSWTVYNINNIANENLKESYRMESQVATYYLDALDVIQKYRLSYAMDFSEKLKKGDIQGYIKSRDKLCAEAVTAINLMILYWKHCQVR